jgi:hypothetical protein
MPMRRLVLALTAALTLCAGYAEAQPREFAAYPAAVVRGARHAPDFARQPQYRQMRTNIARGAGRVNFAGHYALVMMGCGAGCRLVYVVDLLNGRIADFPLGGENNYLLDLEYRPDSRLVRAHWQTQEGATACVHQAFVLDRGGFRSFPQSRRPGACPMR